VRISQIWRERGHRRARRVGLQLAGPSAGITASVRWRDPARREEARVVGSLRDLGFRQESGREEKGAKEEEGEGYAKGKGAGVSAYLYLILVSQICFCFVPFCSCHNLF
jgi:hypothetical protein